ncbi:hypothetical protein D3C86_1379040 [compost metagenome]
MAEQELLGILRALLLHGLGDFRVEEHAAGLLCSFVIVAVVIRRIGDLFDISAHLGRVEHPDQLKHFLM